MFISGNPPFICLRELHTTLGHAAVNIYCSSFDSVIPLVSSAIFHLCCSGRITSLLTLAARLTIPFFASHIKHPPLSKKSLYIITILQSTILLGDSDNTQITIPFSSTCHRARSAISFEPHQATRKNLPVSCSLFFFPVPFFRMSFKKCSSEWPVMIPTKFRHTAQKIRAPNQP